MCTHLHQPPALVPSSMFLFLPLGPARPDLECLSQKWGVSLKILPSRQIVGSGFSCHGYSWFHPLWLQHRRDLHINITHSWQQLFYCIFTFSCSWKVVTGSSTAAFHFFETNWVISSNQVGTCPSPLLGPSSQVTPIYM